MRVSVSRGFKLNLGNYESAEFSIVVTTESEDLYDPDEITKMSPEELVVAQTDFGDEQIEQYITARIKDIRPMVSAESVAVEAFDKQGERK